MHFITGYFFLGTLTFLKKLQLFPGIVFGILSFSANAQEAMNIRLLGEWTSSSVSVNPQGAKFSDLWAFDINGKNYAALCSTDGIHFIEIGADGSMVERDFVQGVHFGPSVVNRDVATFNGYLYAVCDHGFSTLQIIDLHYLPDSVHVVLSTDQFFQRAHSVFVDTSSATLLVCGPSSTINGDRAMDVFSLSNPENPSLLGSFNSVQYVHDAYMRNDTAWLNCGFDGLLVVKINIPFSIQIIGDLPAYPEMGYNHSGWLSEDGRYYVFSDETPNRRMKLCDVSNLNDIQVLSLFHSGTDAQNMAHNMMLFDDYVYVSHYRDGLQIFDISDKSFPQRIAWYDPETVDGFAFSGAWGIYVYRNEHRILISDMQRGLLYYQFDAPPRLASDRTEFGVAPNPAFDVIWFWRSSSRLYPVQLQIWDLSGKIVFEEKFPSIDRFSVDINSWDSGMYFFTISGIEVSTKYSGKFIVSHQ